MAWLSFPSYLDHLRRESARFREVLTSCDPAARVPACPDWDGADLLWHLAEVQLFWAKVVRHRPAAPDEPPIAEEPKAQRPSAYAELLETFDDFSHALVTELERADPADEAWHWSGDRRVATSFRRQAHEALIHRLDAEQTAGVGPAPFDVDLAADGVLEALDVMYGGELPDGTAFEPTGGLVAVELTDADRTFHVEPGRIPEGQWAGPHLLVRPDGSTSATVSGTAADLDVWLWHRAPDTTVSLAGDAALVEAFRSAVSPPLD